MMVLFESLVRPWLVVQQWPFWLNAAWPSMHELFGVQEPPVLTPGLTPSSALLSLGDILYPQ